MIDDAPVQQVLTKHGCMLPSINCVVVQAPCHKLVAHKAIREHMEVEGPVLDHQAMLGVLEGGVRMGRSCVY